MPCVALLSGGKDSLYNMYLAKRDGHNIVAIANLRPPASANSDELDSYMYQTVGHQAINHIAAALDIPLYRAQITGTSLNRDLEYKDDSKTRDDEVEQLYQLLKGIKDEGIEFDSVLVGAIASEYQKSRVENVCKRLDVTMLAYLWKRNQDTLLQEMIDHGFDAIIIKVACMGLEREHVGMSIKDMQSHLRKLNREYEAHICGEGGEYETLVLDCPLYKKRLVLDSFTIVSHSEDPFAPVYYMKPTEMSLIDVDPNRFKKSPKPKQNSPTPSSSNDPVRSSPRFRL